MERGEALQEGLRRSNARFMASMNHILEQYNHPFEDDVLVSMDTLTYDTPYGQKKWGCMSRKAAEKWVKKIFKHNRRSKRNTGEESGDVVSVRRKFDGIHFQDLSVDDRQVQKPRRVPVDSIIRCGERNIPKWITITPPHSSKGHHLTLPVQEPFEISVQQSCDFEDAHSTQVHTVRQKSSENSGVDTADEGEESGDVVSVRRKFDGIHFQDLSVDDRQVQKPRRVPVDSIIRCGERNIPKWITITPPHSSKGHHLTLPVQEPFGSQDAVCRKKLELSIECSSSKHLYLKHSDVPILSNTIASSRHQPFSELGMTLCDSIHGEYQSADEECSWSNITLSDLYQPMVEMLTKLMAKQSQRRELKRKFGHLRSKRQCSRRPKLNVTVDKMRGFGPRKLKKAFHNICSCKSEDDQNPTFGNESREFCCDNCLISNSSTLAPYAYTDANEIKMDYSDTNLEHCASGMGEEVCELTAFPDVVGRMGETFLAEDDSHTSASPRNLEYTESENLAYKCFSEPSFITSTDSSDSRALHLVKDSKTQKTDFCVGTSELCSSACSSHGNRSISISITNCSPARSSSTLFIYPEKIISERQTSFQQKDSFPPLFTEQSPSKMPNKYEDSFDEVYYKVCSEEFQKSLTLTRPLLNTQNLEEKGRLVTSNLSNFRRSTKQCDIEFDRLYEKLCGEFVPKSPQFHSISNFRKYEEIQIPETVNALVNSPVRTYSAISRVKRAGKFQNCVPCSPEKRLKLTPEHWFSSKKCQEISSSKKYSLLTADMDFLSTDNCSNPSFSADHNCHCQGSGSHDSSDKSFLGIPGTSLQGSGTADVHSGRPGAMENCSSPRNARKCHARVYRKLSYTDGRD